MTDPQPHDLPRSDLHRLANRLARALDDLHSLAYYLKVADDWQQGRLAPHRHRYILAMDMIHKADQLAAQRVPKGPIRNPAAVFATWIKTLRML